MIVDKWLKFVNKICLLIFPPPLLSPPPQQTNFHFKTFSRFYTIENVRSKHFFIINNSYASNFTLYNILFILESFLLFAKHFLYQNFSYSNIWEVHYVIYFFQFLNSFPEGDYLFKAMETWVCEICQISMKTSE